MDIRTCIHDRDESLSREKTWSCYQVKGFVDQVLEAERLMLQFYLGLLRPGIFQDIIDYSHESLAAFPDALDLLFLLWSYESSRWRLEKRLRHSSACEAHGSCWQECCS